MRPFLCLVLLAAVSAACSSNPTEEVATPAPSLAVPSTTTEHLLVGMLAEADKTIAEQDDTITRQLACIEAIASVMEGFEQFSLELDDFYATTEKNLTERLFSLDQLFPNPMYDRLHTVEADVGSAWEDVDEACPSLDGFEVLEDSRGRLEDDLIAAQDYCRTLERHYLDVDIDIKAEC